MAKKPPSWAIDLRYIRACEHAAPLGADGADPLEEPLELVVTCQLCGWTGMLYELLHCCDIDGDCSTNLWSPCCKTVDWSFV